MAARELRWYVGTHCTSTRCNSVARIAEQLGVSHDRPNTSQDFFHPHTPLLYSGISAKGRVVVCSHRLHANTPIFRPRKEAISSAINTALHRTHSNLEVLHGFFCRNTLRYATNPGPWQPVRIITLYTKFQTQMSKNPSLSKNKRHRETCPEIRLREGNKKGESGNAKVSNTQKPPRAFPMVSLAKKRKGETILSRIEKLTHRPRNKE